MLVSLRRRLLEGFRSRSPLFPSVNPAKDEWILSSYSTLPPFTENRCPSLKFAKLRVRLHAPPLGPMFEAPFGTHCVRTAGEGQDGGLIPELGGCIAILEQKRLAENKRGIYSRRGVKTVL